MEYRKHSKKRNDKPPTSFRQMVFEYLSRSKVQGYSLIVQMDRPLHERLLWILITVFGIAITIYLVISSYINFLESPTVTTPERVHSHGSNFGLTFLIDNQLEDYVFTMNAFIGTVVLIFDANDYPDQFSGAVREKIISPEQEVYLSLNPTLIRGSRSMKTFEISSRNCVFNEEINLVFANFYSFSECLLTCRITNIIETCGCTPPQYTNLFNSSTCTFTDLACLTHWRVVWINFESHAVNDVHCPECLPKCNRLQHVVHTSNSNFDPKRVKGRSHDSEFMLSVTPFSTAY
ncbi:hypothetical protein HA402_006113 [Bradysia odoriphaga]|nr:hypothetical protein HA402_006113 [Bradysia odoriphaga]